MSRPQRLLEKIIPLEEELIEIVIKKLEKIEDLDNGFEPGEISFLIVYTINNLFRRTILGKQFVPRDKIKKHLMGMLAGYLVTTQPEHH